MQEKEDESGRGSGKGRSCTQLEVKKNGEMMELVSSFKYSGYYFSKDRGPQEDVKMRVDEGLKVFGAIKIMFNVRSLSFCVKREFYERVAALQLVERCTKN